MITTSKHNTVACLSLAASLALLAFAAILLAAPALPTTIAQTKTDNSADRDDPELTKNPGTVRFATFNVSFHRKAPGQLAEQLSDEKPQTQPRRVAEVIQRVRPDVLLLNEFDYDAAGKGIQAFQKNLLGVSQNAQPPITYPHVYFAAVNTGTPSGVDLNNDNQVEPSGADAFGFGTFPGQYGMVVLSRYPIQRNQIRTFQKFLWKDMPDNLMPTQVGSDLPFYSAAATKIFRLPSKSHWDVPIDVDGKTIHFLVAHPTPPVFDDAEDRNGRRNHDEIRLFADYVTPGKADYLYDDQGARGGLPAGSRFVIAGDMNADPNDGDSYPNAARQLTQHPLINQQRTPQSRGASLAAASQGNKNLRQTGASKFDTGDFDDWSTGNLRIDYCLPSKNLLIQKSGVFWPTNDDTNANLNAASDHHMAWIDISTN